MGSPIFVILLTFFSLFTTIQQELIAKTFGPNNPHNKDESFISWGIDPQFSSSNIKLTEALENFAPKKTIIVAVIDTGIDPEHPFLKNNLYALGSKASNKNFGHDFSIKTGITTTPIDDHGHGTHVSGIIKSVYQDVKLVSLKYYNPNATGSENLIATIKALEKAITSNVDIINYSGGGPEASAEELKLLKIAEEKGILVVAAAGNEHSDIDQKKNAYYPASYQLTNMITVTAHDQTKDILPSSNWGKKTVDLAAPGNKIKSSLPYGRSGLMTGTSQATAFVSGVAALIKAQYPQLKANEIKLILNQTVQKAPSLKEKCLSEGILDAKKALDYAKNFVATENHILKQIQVVHNF